MQSFQYARARDVSTAVQALRTPGMRVLAGGTELLNWMRDGIESPSHVLDIGDLPMTDIEVTPQGLRLGALATMSMVAAHPEIRSGYPVLSQSLELAASPQVRNRGTMGGNILQRTRCPYFRAETPLPCNKREPGSGCSAREGENRSHAIFGWSDACVATHPSDLAVALAALDASVHVRGPAGERTVRFTDFHQLPERDPRRETALRADEIITAISVPAHTSTRTSHYLKVRERSSYEFAMVSVAAAVALSPDSRTIQGARIALGGVALKPWRLTRAEEALRGVAFEPSAMTRAIDGAFGDARPLAHNGFKIPLAKNAVLRALEHAGGLP